MRRRKWAATFCQIILVFFRYDNSPSHIWKSPWSDYGAVLILDSDFSHYLSKERCMGKSRGAIREASPCSDGTLLLE